MTLKEKENAAVICKWEEDEDVVYILATFIRVYAKETGISEQKILKKIKWSINMSEKMEGKE